MPSIIPTTSLRSSDSSVSSFSDVSVDANFCNSGYMEDRSTDSSQEDSSSLLKRRLNGSNLQVKFSGFHEINDSEFGLPPEPEDNEDDVVDRVAITDGNDDEYDDGYNFNKEEKLKAMSNIRNGKFKALVSQLVKSVGVDSSCNSGENWVDIVTSLSWEAADFVKPHTNEGNAMDPDGYVKVKCIATGLRTQSRLFKGLVFKKHAAHKHMPTKHENPRLLLIHGSLDLSSGGLSSFESMQQEKDKFKSTIEMIDMYQPNVILVEKSVSRGIQESIFSKGITLIFDMKLHRLERVARCIGSLSKDVANGQQIRLCDSFRIEKFVEEHDIYHECGRKPIKTLMFLEGCSPQLGCTIELMGANNDELKRIKRVTRCAVVMAYRLKLETCFLLDQRAMFSTISPADVAPTNKQLTLICADEATSDTEMSTPFIVDIQISSGFDKNDSAEDHMLRKDEISEILDSQSILILMSRRNASKGIICEKSHFSHIKFYLRFDVPLGKFLQDNLLNQRHQCKICGETPEVHHYYYAHHNKQLRIRVRHVPVRKTLRETEGKLWMWSRCVHCNSNSTKRVLISTDACGLSFGKFLELGFSNHSSFNSPSNCGHSFHKDFLYFFGLGTMVAMFEYSPIATYSVSLPPQKMEVCGSVRADFLEKDSENVYLKGISMFLDIEKSLKDIGSRYVGVTLNIQGSIKKFSDIELILKHEKSQFKVHIQDAVKNEREDDTARKLLRLNRIRLELLYESCIWDRRLHSLLSSNLKVIDAVLVGSNVQENILRKNGTPEEECREIPIDGQVEESTRNNSLLSNLENGESCMWAPFADILRKYMEDLERGYFPKIESYNSYDAESTAQKLINDEGPRLHIPLGTDDYIVSDYEDEYSSIIGCALTLLKDLDEDSARKEKGTDSSSNSKRLTQMFSLTCDTNLDDTHSSSFDVLNFCDSSVFNNPSHLQVSMGARIYQAKRKYSVYCLYASQFRQLRNWCCPSEVDYIASLSRCRNWDAKGGKSKSFFAKTLDDRFIIKEIKKSEFDSFVTFAVDYFEYLNQCRELGNQTCLAKILGIYQVVIRSPKNGKETRHDLLVMENLSFGRNISRQYDLKGALHARFCTAGDVSGDVLLDQNFVNDMNVSPLYISRKSKRNLQRAIYNDTNFLNSINVMDYSLLVGVDIQRRELGCGIIDYLRQYTWDKQIENWVKSSLVVPRNQLPTIISPIDYKNRFRKFTDAHFLSVPDHWCSQRSSNPCKLCGPAFDNVSLHKKSLKRGNEDDDSSRSTSQKQGKHEEGSSKSPHHSKENGFFLADFC